MSSSHKRILTIAIVIQAHAFAAFAQTTITPVKPAPMRRGVMSMQPIPLNHVYWHFFMYQEHLEKVSAERDKQGKDSSWLRDHFQTSLGFSYRDFNIVRATALYVSQEIMRLNQREKVIIDTDRAAMKANPLPPGVPPPGIAQLKLITLDRENMLNTQIDQMNRALGPVNAEKLKSYLMQSVQNGPKTESPAQVSK